MLGRKNTLHIPIDATFTPKSEYILTGGSDGVLNIYTNNRIKRSDEGKLTEIPSNKREAITAVEFNPKYTMFATASSHAAFWVPQVEE